MPVKPEQVSHKQMRLLRIRYDALNKESGKLVFKKELEAYIGELRRLVETALKNSGFDRQPVVIDRTTGAKIEPFTAVSKGNVSRRV